MPKSEVFNTDCLEAMRQMPDKAFDIAIVDPPYGIKRDGGETGKHWKWYEPKEWDSAPPSAEYFTELFRVSRNQIIWGANYFNQHLPASMGYVFWDKGQDLTMSDGEIAFTSFQRALRRVIINRCHIAESGGKIHPTAKPIKLYKWLLQNYAKEGDTILDTHLGSGSSRIAAYDLGFDFTGYELDNDYYLAQEKRFAEHLAQPKLFTAPQPMVEVVSLF